MQCTGEALWSGTLEAYMIILSNVTPISFLKRKQSWFHWVYFFPHLKKILMERIKWSVRWKEMPSFSIASGREVLVTVGKKEALGRVGADTWGFCGNDWDEQGGQAPFAWDGKSRTALGILAKGFSDRWTLVTWCLLDGRKNCQSWELCPTNTCVSPGSISFVFGKW